MAVAKPLRTSATAAAVERALLGQVRPWGEYIFQGLLALALIVSLAVLLWLLSDVVIRSLPVWTDRGLPDFATKNLSSNPDNAGIAQGLFGSLVLMAIVGVLAIPVGVAAAIYLEEYAPDNRATRLLNTTVRNLAGVPAVVYGLLGLAVFVGVQERLDPGSGRNLIAGGLTLTVVVLPIVIITSAEALRSVPRAIREAGFGVGATKWEVVRSHVLPYAAPGIFTGVILTIARAFGETAPLILVGAAASFGQAANASLLDKISGPYTSLPTTIYRWATLPQDEFKHLTAAAIVVLLAVVLIINAIAILLRNRYERRW